MTNPYELSDDMPVYVISVAAQLSDMHPQTLRAYDRLGLVSPGRSQGRRRRYSMRDILALREIQRLSQEEGVNLSGIKLLLDQHRELEQARRLIAARHAELRRTGHDTPSGLVPVRSARVAVWEPMTGPSSGSGQPRGDK